MTHGGNTLTLKTVPVTQVNILLCASYQLYRHIERGETIVRTVGYSLPAPLHWHVLTVVLTTSFVPPARNGHRGIALTGRVVSVTPSFLRWLYNTETYTPTIERET
ncbi:hypothetical protein EDB83DRAFT_2521374 [Lactarius deliciosus]|nr:hypothetical protein EDB83DRAFT_2521374 [Lactarius deliciosus]